MPSLNSDLKLDEACLCGSGLAYQACCYPYHSQTAYPETAEQLMRSRYVAYAKQLEPYLVSTWQKGHRPESFDFDGNLYWQKLVINGKKKGRKRDQEGWVTFTAFYRVGLDEYQFQEKSYFRRDENHHWCYVEGDIKE